MDPIVTLRGFSRLNQDWEPQISLLGSLETCSHVLTHIYIYIVTDDRPPAVVSQAVRAAERWTRRYVEAERRRIMRLAETAGILRRCVWPYLLRGMHYSPPQIGKHVAAVQDLVGPG